MNTGISQRLEALEYRRQSLLDRVKAMTPEQQQKKSDPKSFSPVEVIMHMAMSEQAGIERMKKTPPEKLKNKKSNPSFIYKKVVADMNQAKKIGTPPNMVPQGRVTMERAEQEWNKARAEYTKYFAMMPSQDTAMQSYFPFGTLSAHDVLVLLESHHHYHEMLFPNV